MVRSFVIIQLSVASLGFWMTVCQKHSLSKGKIGNDVFDCLELGGVLSEGEKRVKKGLRQLCDCLNPSLFETQMPCFEQVHRQKPTTTIVNQSE